MKRKTLIGSRRKKAKATEQVVGGITEEEYLKYAYVRFHAHYDVEAEPERAAAESGLTFERFRLILNHELHLRFFYHRPFMIALHKWMNEEMF